MNYDALLIHGWKVKTDEPFAKLEEAFGLCWPSTEVLAAAPAEPGHAIVGLALHWSSPQSAVGYNVTSSMLDKCKKQLKDYDPEALAVQCGGTIVDPTAGFWFCRAPGQQAFTLWAFADQVKVPLVTLDDDALAASFLTDTRGLRESAPAIFAAGLKRSNIMLTVTPASEPLEA